MKLTTKSNNLILNFNKQKSKLEVSLGEKNNLIFRVDDDNSSVIDKAGEYEYSSIHFLGMENAISDFQSILDIAQVTNKRNIGFLFISVAGDIDPSMLKDIDNVNVIVGMTNNLSIINKMVKRYTPEVLIIPNSLKTLEISIDDVKKSVTDINIAEEQSDTIDIDEESFNLEDDSITTTYFL